MTYVLDPKTLIQLLLAEDAMAEGVVQIEDVGQDEILLSYGTDCILPWNNAPDERVQINGEGYFLCSYEAQEAGWRVTIGFPETIVENQTKKYYVYHSVLHLPGNFYCVMSDHFFSVTGNMRT